MTTKGFKPTRFCKLCGGEIKKRPRFESRAAYAAKIYCSRKCHTNDPEWRSKVSTWVNGRTPWNKGKPMLMHIGNKYAYLGDKAGAAAGNYRARIKFKRDSCEKCGAKKESFHMVLHHHDHNTLNNAKSNIQVLCRSCHAKHHAAERKANHQ